MLIAATASDGGLALLWAVLWEIVGQLDLTILLPPLSRVLVRMVEIVPTADLPVGALGDRPTPSSSAMSSPSSSACRSAS